MLILWKIRKVKTKVKVTEITEAFLPPVKEQKLGMILKKKRYFVFL
jgi:hypothetical protein